MNEFVKSSKNNSGQGHTLFLGRASRRRDGSILSGKLMGSAQKCWEECPGSDGVRDTSILPSQCFLHDLGLLGSLKELPLETLQLRVSAPSSRACCLVYEANVKSGLQTSVGRVQGSTWDLEMNGDRARGGVPVSRTDIPP